ncbi:hypothetical protein NPIL_18031 [Nephila pilipes]|uniref:Uncharacterized protein n=1 Tax=Nephila pilipes TaxID=299642 RepID=A0A8X6MRC9_NEPPI|nr:hypothetical protein NPIL_18031 [Nephila pilipes]
MHSARQRLKHGCSPYFCWQRPLKARHTISPNAGLLAAANCAMHTRLTGFFILSRELRRTGLSAMTEQLLVTQCNQKDFSPYRSNIGPQRRYPNLLAGGILGNEIESWFMTSGLERYDDIR